MLNLIKSEFTKILTLPSTYIVAAVLALLSILIGVIAVVAGTVLTGDSSAAPNAIYSAVVTTLHNGIALLAIIAALIILNEYRHNTIAYTLTTSSNRYLVFGAKAIATLGYGLGLSLVLSIIAAITASIAIVGTGNSLSDQVFNVGSALVHLGLYVSAYLLVGLFLGFILRNIIIVIVIVFVVPIIESILGVFLKEGAAYLPFRAIGSLADSGEHAAAAGVIVAAVVYVLALGAVALVSFTKRDA